MPVELILKSVPVLPVWKVWEVADRPLNELIQELMGRSQDKVLTQPVVEVTVRTRPKAAEEGKL